MKYSPGNIYKIINKVDSKFCYIGSTFTTLSQRFQSHIAQYNQFLKNGKNEFSLYKYFTKYGVENFKIILIKQYTVCRESQRDFKHLHAYELLWVNKSSNCCNKLLPFNPLKHFLRKEYQKSDKYKESKKKYEQSDKCKERQKKYGQSDKYKEYQKSDKRKESQRKLQKIKIICECGDEVTKYHLPKHILCKKHIDKMKIINQNTF